MISVRSGQLEEVIEIQSQIQELAGGYPLTKYEAQLKDKAHLILVAESESSLVGFKVGYELSTEVFYSWMGGVTPAARRNGVADALLVAQEDWVRGNGYKELQVKTWNQHKNMLRFLISHDYQIWAVDPQPDSSETRVHFKKHL